MVFSPSVWGGSVMMRRRPLMGMRRSHSRHHSRRGRGIWDTIKSGISAVAPHALPILRDLGIKLVRSKLGVGRRHRRSRMGSRKVSRGGLFSSLRSRSLTGSRRRRSHRSRGGYVSFPFMATRGMSRRRSHRSRGYGSMFGSKRRHRRRVGLRRRHRRVGRKMLAGARRHRRRVGRGPIGGIAGGILGKVLGQLLPF